MFISVYYHNNSTFAQHHQELLFTNQQNNESALCMTLEVQRHVRAEVWFAAASGVKVQAWLIMLLPVVQHRNVISPAHDSSEASL